VSHTLFFLIGFISGLSIGALVVMYALERETRW
jgi:hypothetical protein